MEQADLICLRYLTRLRKSPFKGDIEDSYGARIVASTDNSVYQVIPRAIIYPKESNDINQVVSLLNSSEFVKSGLSLVMRGGGTGTNGQSLNNSLILDTSRYLNRIISLDQTKKTVTVEPGVVLDQLNSYLGEYDLFFPPDVSSSSRATLGGMVATDASGKGSRIYGKTSDYIAQLECVLSDGSDFKVAPELMDDLVNSDNSLVNKVQIAELILQNQQEIEQVFPKMNRGLTGYNLKQAVSNNTLNLNYLLAGSEGTLALTKQITLKVIPKPKYRALIVVLYGDFEKALEHAQPLLVAEPTAIEVLDDKILEAAQRDPIWQDVKAAFKDIDLDEGIQGLNFIEFTGDKHAVILERCDQLEKIIRQTRNTYQIIGHLTETKSEIIRSLWNIRKRSVGLLGALKGKRQPTAFVEDTAVPPESLACYIKDFRAILDEHGLDYGMYGHADVGCLHVRPALNMQDPEDQKCIREITDKVAKLSKSYGGLLWGEHGRGYRGEYSPQFFGEKLMPILGEIKAIFDPHNLFNPGKLAVPTGFDARVIGIDQIPFRGTFDSQIVNKHKQEYNLAMRCNGNGACFSWDSSEAMCPSYKVTRDKRLSPKGRAAMLREWLRLTTKPAHNLDKLKPLESELFESLDSCLSCKSCTHSCPIKVDIPELKSRFLENYYTHHRRPISDYVFASFEQIASFGRTFPRFTNRLMSVGAGLLDKTLGIINTPEFSVSLPKSLKKRDAKILDLKEKLTLDQHNGVILIPDSFNASYASEVILATYDVLTALGYQVYLAPILQNGKALHVKGFRKRFLNVTAKQVDQIETLAATGLPLISVEVVTRLMHQKEYPELLKRKLNYQIESFESWLDSEISKQPHIAGKLSRLLNKGDRNVSFELLPHCMEQTSDKTSAGQWKRIFNRAGLNLQSKNAGCCGMSGLFGHEKQNRTLSEALFSQNWKPQLATQNVLLATGFSCRCQCHNHGYKIRHPVEILAAELS